MDGFKKFSSDLTTYNFFWISISGLVGVGSFLLFHNVLDFDQTLALGLTIVMVIVLSFGVAKLITLAATQPLKAVWLAIVHAGQAGNTPASEAHELTHGRELAFDLIDQINALGGNDSQANMPGSNLTELLPLPVIALDKNDTVVLLNQLAAKFIGRPTEELIGKSVNDVLQLSFRSRDTLEGWLNTSKQNSVTAEASWDHVRLQPAGEGEVKQFDLAAHYGKDNPAGYDTLLMFFDHTKIYSSEDTTASYVALAVHELRTPLTLLRGYIEVFEEELDTQLTPELKDFMHKMAASAQTLTAFVSNILNVARVDENQLTLSLHEANWNELLPEIVHDIELRAKVRGKSLELDIEPNLPTVAIDKISIYEVVSNLIDNAIKYSDESNKIVIHAHKGKDGTIETVVQDFGFGIPEGSLKYLFTKFYRGHRSKGMVSGSGLGLYLVKAIVTAHGGHVWVSSQEGEGSSFGFSLQPFSSLSEELKDKAGNGSIERQAHGWIKNHSIYRR